MTVTTFDIIGRCKARPIAVASAADFEVAPAADCDPQLLVRSPSISPYCIDPKHGQVVLVELPDGIDLASVPFVYEAQYHHARRLHRIGIGDFTTLAAGLSIQARPVFLQSTGRSGSTLLARTLARAEGVATLSEPDVFSRLAMAGRLHSRAARDRFAQLYRGLLRYFLRDRSGILVFKFRALVCEHADYLAAAWPDAASIFLYRNAVAVARSYARVTGRTLSDWALSPQEIGAWARFAPVVRSLAPPVTGHDLMAALWAGPVLRHLDGRASSAWSGSVDYDDLLARPGPIIAAILGGIGQDPMHAPATVPLDAAHSQEGSHLAPERLHGNPRLEVELGSATFARLLARSLSRIDPRLVPDLKLPGSL